MRRAALPGSALAAALALAGMRADAGVLERVRHAGVLHCGAEPRSGVAELRGDGTLGGVAVTLCRRIAAAILGPRAPFVFRLYGSPRDFDAVRGGRDEVSFLSAPAIAEQDVTDRIIPGPAVFQVRLSLLVRRIASYRRPRDLAGQAICFMIASSAQHALDADFRIWHRDFLHMGYEEEDEMADAYDVGRCAAMVGEASELARMTDAQGVNRVDSRILPESLGGFAVIAATPAGDPAWSAVTRSELGRR